MAAGHPLDDEDRLAWLEALNRLLLSWHQGGQSGVLACSALKEKYRLTLQAGMPEGTITFCLLDGSKEMIAARLAHRHHEYMNPKLLDSQIATLERPSEDEAWRIVNDRTPDQVVDEILAEMPDASGAQHPTAGADGQPGTSHEEGKS
jgi:gluconokinase